MLQTIVLGLVIATPICTLFTYREIFRCTEYSRCKKLTYSFTSGIAMAAAAVGLAIITTK